MHWVLQSNLYGEKSFADLVDQLERQQVPHTLVKLVPFDHIIVPDVDIDGPVFVCGSTSLGKVAEKKGWKPGYFDENLNMETVTSHYGDEMLNFNMVVSKLKDVKYRWDRFFIRPVSDKKQFAGTVMDWEEFSTWQQQIIELDGTSSWTSLTGDDEILVAPVVDILQEYRFFVVDGNIVTGSLYKRGTQVFYSSDVDQPVIDYAQKMVNVWEPNRAFCLDVAVTAGGYRVIEINALNSSGFYECDMGKFVQAINDMEYKDYSCNSILI